MAAESGGETLLLSRPIYPETAKINFKLHHIFIQQLSSQDIPFGEVSFDEVPNKFHPMVTKKKATSMARIPYKWPMPLSKVLDVASSGDVYLNQAASGEAAAPSSKDFNYAPRQAAQKGYKAVVTLLLARSDIEINFKHSAGWTPLSLAAGHGHHTAFGPPLMLTLTSRILAD